MSDNKNEIALAIIDKARKERETHLRNEHNECLEVVNILEDLTRHPVDKGHGISISGKNYNSKCSELHEFVNRINNLNGTINFDLTKTSSVNYIDPHIDIDNEKITYRVYKI